MATKSIYSAYVNRRRREIKRERDAIQKRIDAARADRAHGHGTPPRKRDALREGDWYGERAE